MENNACVSRLNGGIAFRPPPLPKYATGHWSGGPYWSFWWPSNQSDIICKKAMKLLLIVIICFIITWFYAVCLIFQHHFFCLFYWICFILKSSSCAVDIIRETTACLGRALFVFHCQEATDWVTIGNMFKGFATAGSFYYTNQALI